MSGHIDEVYHIEIPPPLCPGCGEPAEAKSDEPLFLVTWTRGPGDPPGIGPLYHTRCYEQQEIECPSE